MLTVLVSTISYSCEYANANSTHIFFSKNISIYLMIKVLTNNIVSFEQLGPGGYR